MFLIFYFTDIVYLPGEFSGV